MELGRAPLPGMGPRRGVSPGSEALLDVLRPHCMGAMMAMEDLLGSAGNPASTATDPNAATGAAQAAPDGAAAASISAGRRLEASLASLRSALGAVVASFSSTDPTPTSSSPSLSQAETLRAAFSSALPYIMLPLELVLTPSGGRGAAGGGDGSTGKGRRGVPIGAREKAFRCVAEAIRGGGSQFVKGYGVKPTIHVLIRLNFTLSECSPMGGGLSGQQSQNASSSGSSAPTAARGREGDSGLTAGTDALRLACLECLEVLLRAPFATEGDRIRSGSGSQSGWSEVRNGLKDAVRGGMLAQLVQELLLCCQQGGVPAVATTTTAATETTNKGAALPNDGTDATTKAAAAGGGRRTMAWGGAEEARAAAGCLDALCSFAPGTTLWRRLLPGTFSGLFRAIRGIEVGSGLSGDGGGAGGIGSTLALGGGLRGPGSQMPSTATGGVGDRRRGWGGSKSALAEACLGVLAKVLLMCAGEGRTGAASDPPSSGRSVGIEDSRGSDGSGSGGGAGVGGNIETPDGADPGNPLMALERLAVSSNASSRTADAQDHRATATGTAPIPSATGRGEGEALLPKPTPSGAAAAAAAAAATVIAVEDPEWEARTSDRLRLLLPPLLAFCCLHPGWRVRRATAHLAAEMLRASCGDGGGGGSSADAECGGGIGKGRREGESGLLKPLTALLVEALVGLLLDGMPQVSAAARRGLDAFRATLTPFRWLELRGVLLERLCTIAEGLPVLAKSADEKRLRAAFDLMAGYMALLRFDARAALDGRLSTVLSCLCEALEFDEDFNVQVLEGSSAGSSSNGTRNGSGEKSSTRGQPQQVLPKYYRQVLANVREDSTLSSARRAVRLLGKFCDLTSLADAAISSLESRPPRPPPPPPPSPAPWPSSSPSAATAVSSAPMLAARPTLTPELTFSQESGGSGGSSSSSSSRNDALYRRRCLKWLRLRLPLAWVLNQALLGRMPGLNFGGGSGGGGSVNATAEANADAGPTAGSESSESQTQNGGGEAAAAEAAEERLLGRDVAMSLLERLLASHAFALPVSRVEAAAAGYTGNYGSGDGDQTVVANGNTTAQPPRALEYTRSGAVLGAGVGGARSRASGVSGQVLDANATLVSTVVEALGSLAEASGPECGEAFLRRALYPLLEKVASTHPVVSQAALATLSRVRSACGDFDDMSQLLEENMDYVVDDVVRRVSYSSRRSRGVGNSSMPAFETGRGVVGGGSGIPSVVEAVLRIGGSAMGPALVRDLAGVTLREVDACAWDPRETRRSLGVLRAVASCVTLPPLTSSDPSEARVPPKWEVETAEGPAEKAKRHEEDGKNENRSEAHGDGISGLAESPWFRQLFVEFADTPDIRRVEEMSSAAADGEGGATSALLEAVKDHREAMGFDVLDDDRESETERNKTRWRETEDEARKAAGLREGFGDQEEAGEQEEGQLPEPDAEGRRMAESEEVKTLSEVLARSCHFLANPSLETQATALACMRDCVVKLASAGADAALLPHVHRAWRPLMASLREHLTPLPPTAVTEVNGGPLNGVSSLSSRRAVLLHALDTVDALVDVCGDFLSSKVAEDLWPLLKLLLLKYAASTAAGGSNGNNETASTTVARGKREATHSTLFSSSSKTRSPPPSEPSTEGLFLVGSKLNDSANGFANGIADGEGGGSGGLGSVLLVPPREPPGGGSGGGTTAGWVGVNWRGGGSGGGRQGSMGEKVVARALECLERLCGSEDCERFMTPLAREVAVAALPCLSSAGPEPIRSRAEALFQRLAFLDGDGVWLLLMQTMDTAAQQPGAHLPQLQLQQQSQRQRALLGAAGASTNAGRKDNNRGGSRAGERVAEPGVVAARRGVPSFTLTGTTELVVLSIDESSHESRDHRV
eukprot:g10806.t2